MLPREGHHVEFPVQLLDGRITAMVVYGPPTNALGRFRNRVRGWIGLDPIDQVYYTWFDSEWRPPS